MRPQHWSAECSFPGRFSVPESCWVQDGQVNWKFWTFPYHQYFLYLNKMSLSKKYLDRCSKCSFSKYVNCQDKKNNIKNTSIQKFGAVRESLSRDPLQLSINVTAWIFNLSPPSPPKNWKTWRLVNIWSRMRFWHDKNDCIGNLEHSQIWNAI